MDNKVTSGAFTRFCLQTSLHGWQYMVIVAGPDGKVGKANAFWSVIVLLSMATASTFLYNNTWVSKGYDSDFKAYGVNPWM